MLEMKFTKMQGAGNDYIYVNAFEEHVEKAPELARKISDRHFGVGADGLILVLPPRQDGSDCRMEMYNADGSRAQMCGNGIRCVAKYAYDNRIARRSEIRIDTDAGRKTVKVRTGPDGKVAEAEVDMGSPILPSARIPMSGGDPEMPAVNVPLEILGQVFRVTAVSMGNPHCVLRVDLQDEETLRSIRRRDGKRLSELPLGGWPLEELGPHFENHPCFPEKVNTEFVRCRSSQELDFRVWERGSGETLACGTGACAAVVAGVLNGWCDREVAVHVRGGDLRVRWEGAERSPGSVWLVGGTVFLAGPAVEVFTGQWPLTSS